MTANVVRYFSAAFVSTVIVGQCTPRRADCESSICSRLAPTLARRFRALLSAVALLGATACASRPAPEPKAAATQFAAAVARRDATAVHAMLDEQSRRSVTVEEVQALLDRDAPNVARRIQDTTKRPARVEAKLLMPGGESVVLTREADSYFVQDGSALFGFAVTPQEALVGLRRALEQPDYQLLLQLLSTETREQVESRRRALVQALSDLAVVDIAVQGERAVVSTADGHRVELELESGVWRVRDFE